MNTDQIIHTIDDRFSNLDDQFESLKQKLNELKAFLPTTSEETKQEHEEPPCICEELTSLDDNIMKLNKNVQTLRGIVADLVVGLCQDEEIMEYLLVKRLGYNEETVQNIRSNVEKNKFFVFNTKQGEENERKIEQLEKDNQELIERLARLEKFMYNII
jgi:chromosome segregation ATPase